MIYQIYYKYMTKSVYRIQYEKISYQNNMPKFVVRQGSNLGPPLILIYITDISLKIDDMISSVQT